MPIPVTKPPAGISTKYQNKKESSPHFINFSDNPYSSDLVNALDKANPDGDLVLSINTASSIFDEESYQKLVCPLAKESAQFQAYVVYRQLAGHVNGNEKLIENEGLEEKAKEKAAILIQKTARGFLGRRKN